MRARTTLVLAAALALTPASALAADATVEAQSSNAFSPKDVTVNVGEQVTFKNAGGFHDVVFKDGSFREPASPSFSSWTVARRFDKPGKFEFVCSVHEDRGMTGTVTVIDTSLPTPEATAFSAKLRSVKGKTVKLTISSSGAATVNGALDRKDKSGRYKRYGAVRFDLAAGQTSATLTKTTKGKRFTKGSYRLKLTALTHSSTVRFNVT